MEIIDEINRRFPAEMQTRLPNEPDRWARMSLIGEDGDRQGMVGLQSGRFTGGDRNLFALLVNDPLTTDRFFLLADFDDYVRAQGEAGEVFSGLQRWGDG